jgi:hypothetical protein
MKIRYQFLIFPISMLFGAITCLNGCATSGIYGVRADTTQCGMNTGCTVSGDLEATTRTGSGK